MTKCRAVACELPDVRHHNVADESDDDVLVVVPTCDRHDVDEGDADIDGVEVSKCPFTARELPNARDHCDVDKVDVDIDAS